MNAFKAPARFLAIFGLVLSAVLIGSAGTASAANPLRCFDGTTDTAHNQTGGAVYGGVCTLDASGTGATLDNSVPVGSGDYSGVYYATSSLSGKRLSEITELSFTYTGVPTAGSPRISLPIDSDGNGTTNFYAFIGAFYCNDSAGLSAGLVDPIHDATCTIFHTGGPDAGYPTWAAFVATNPTWRVSSSVPFVIADDAGLWTVGNVHFGVAANAVTKKDECKKGGWADMTREDGSSFKNQGDCIQYVNTGK